MNYSRLCTRCMREVEADTGQLCPFCGQPYHAAVRKQHQMKPFSVLKGRYLVGDVLSEGGLWIIYVCLDMVLQVKRVIKEFFPANYFTRKSDITSDVIFREEQNIESVLKWKETLLKEAGKLARFSNLPGMAGVCDYFSENQTIYIVEGYFEGITLKTYVNSAGGKVHAKPLLELLEPIILSLQKVHEQGLVHADIYPDKFLCLQSGSMILLKLEEAVAWDNDNGRGVVVKCNPGYSPEEQYRIKGKLGPWSDVYAVAATIYRCLTGVTPPEALERMCADKLTIPDSLEEELTHRQKKALLKALSVYAEDRYQSMEEFHKDLYYKSEQRGGLKMGLFDKFKKKKQAAPFHAQNASKEEIFKMILEQQAQRSPSEQFASGAVFDILRKEREIFEHVARANNALTLQKLFADAYSLFLNNPEVVGLSHNMVNKNNNDTDTWTWNADIFSLNEEDHAILLFMPVQDTAFTARIVGIILSRKGDGYYYCMLNKDEKIPSDVNRNKAMSGIEKIGEVKGLGFELMNSFLNCMKDNFYR